jgi:hypothetical protein
MMRVKLIITGLLLAIGLGACGEYRVPKSVTVVPHVIKSIDTVERYNGSVLNYETHYRYEFWDSTPPVVLKKNSMYKVGDTIEYTFVRY